MKISEYIEALEKVKAEFGDVEVHTKGFVGVCVCGYGYIMESKQ